jgi:hypothetical protein
MAARQGMRSVAKGLLQEIHLLQPQILKQQREWNTYTTLRTVLNEQHSHGQLTALLRQVNTTLQRTVVDVAGLSAVLDETSALCATQDEFTALFEPDTLDSEELESELDALCLQFPVVPTNALQSKPVSAVRLVTTPV